MTSDSIPVAAPVLNGNERRYVLDCIDSGWISTHGAYVPRFEQAFAEHIGCRHAIGCSNGTAALHLCLAALDIGPGDEVIVPTLTYVATANAVRYLGARPVFVDVEPDIWTLAPVAFAAAVGPRTRAVIPVHLYGHPAAMPEILDIARATGIAVIEDAAQAQGTSLAGRMAGSLGTLAAFSFFGNKTLTCGQGGMVTTDDDRLAERLRHLARVAMHPDRPYWHDEVGYNYRLTNIQAAIGLAQLEQVHWHLERRRAVAAGYRERLAHLPQVRFQQQRADVRHGHWMVNVRIDAADADSIVACRLALSERGVETRVGFPPLHLLPPYAEATPSSFPVAEAVSRESLTLPTHAALTPSQLDRVCDGLAAFLARREASLRPAS
ncbi:MAG: DegT/DnrJ/EryC1/StrS family aminotransferase [Thiohalocapsa sp. PB-PSB1]|jgi:perosamine synthetase|nr:MAG: DegT/DnrJ/EryC1/StrS family aminotransferase [Thiohalocapsa sp. PB-PSB1]HCS90689.1 aminotransferase DegT [Chromatiaceae bacterium]